MSQPYDPAGLPELITEETAAVELVAMRSRHDPQMLNQHERAQLSEK